MIDPFGITTKKTNINNIQLFYKYIKPIKGYDLLSNLSWDSYILLHYSKLHKNIIYLGNININYNQTDKKFYLYSISSEYIKNIIKLVKKINPTIQKLIFTLEINLNKYTHINSIVVNLIKKTIAIFDPWGKNGTFKKVINYYNKIKIKILTKLFKSLPNFTIYDIASKYNIIGPQDTTISTKSTEIINFTNVQHNSLITTNKCINRHYFYQKQDTNNIYVKEYPATKLIKLTKINTFYNPVGFDIYMGICDIYGLYFLLLIILNPTKSEHEIHKYIVSNNNYKNIQLKISNLVDWILSWFYYQIKQTFANKYKLAIINNNINFTNYIKKDILDLNRLSTFDKKYSDIISNKYCINININKIYKIITYKYNFNIDYIKNLIKNDNKLKNNCLLFLSIKNIYDIF